MPAGRPKTQLTELPSDWRETILKMMGQGASMVEIKAKFRISNELWERWMKEEVKFEETIKEGLELSQAWWEKHGRSELKNNKFNSVLWYMNMKNRFGWKDKTDITSNGKTLNTAKDVMLSLHEAGRSQKTTGAD